MLVPPTRAPGAESSPVVAAEGRDNCYRCHKPRVLCICGNLPRVENRTEIIIIQHPRERFHPLGTARIATLALSRVQLHVAFRASEHDKRVCLPLSLPPGTGLLYPRPGALQLPQGGAGVNPRGQPPSPPGVQPSPPPRDDALEAAPPDPAVTGATSGPGSAPERLVVLDGTWSQAHRLYQDNPWLHGLPHYRLDPEQPSRYRIRREPKPHCVSTIESIAMALRVLEPATRGVDALVAALDDMVDAQIRHRPEGRSRARHRRRPSLRRPARVPHVLVDEPERVVVVYGETAQLSTRSDRRVPEPLQWAAARLDDDVLFDQLVAPAGERASDAGYLWRVGLAEADLRAAATGPEVAARFVRFLREGDVLAAWNPSTLKLLSYLCGDRHPTLLLKSAYCNLRGGRCGTLEEVLERESLRAESLALRGRAGRRLGNARAIARHLTSHGRAD